MDKTNALALPGTITEVALILPDGLLFSEWEKAVNTLSKINRACQWWIGDAVLYGESNYGEKYAQVLDATGFDYETVKADKWVSGSFSVVRRRTTLSWSHHREVAALEPDEQDKWLDKAEKENLTREDLRRAIRTQRQFEADTKPVSVKGVRLFYGDMLDVLPTLDRDYDLVITDPPYNVTDWDWDKIGTPKQFLDLTTQWLNAVMLKLKPRYNLFWFCSPRYSADIEMVMRDLGLPIQSRLVWHRRNMAMGSDSKQRFIDSWEMIYHCGNRDLNFPVEWNDGRFDVQTFAVPQTNFTDQKLHPTQKPLELIRWLVDYGSFPGDAILDPFAGSGTTGAATEGTRDCDLIESDEASVNIIEGRLNCVRT